MSPSLVAFFGVLSGTALVFSPPGAVALALVADGLLLWPSQLFRRRARYLPAALAQIVVLFSVLGVASVVAGTAPRAVVADLLRRLDWVVLALVFLAVVRAFVEPPILLAWLDWARAPRWLSYLVLSVRELLESLPRTAGRQTALLIRKGVGQGSLRNRFQAYYRIVAPLFAVLLRRQISHSRALGLRGFLAPVEARPFPFHPATRDDLLVAGRLVAVQLASTWLLQ